MNDDSQYDDPRLSDAAPSTSDDESRERGMSARGKLHCYNWLDGISDSGDYPIVEVQFKNTSKGYYRNSDNLPLKIGDIVAVEAAPGHDIGQVTLVGRLVAAQIRKGNVHNADELRRVFRIARPSDIEKYEEAKAREQDTMIQSRRIAEELNLNMKIGDVEYQGDGTKAIFYYIADERVDFRKLIRVLADTFHIRVEMRQIGARQEAGRIGGIGPCGRPLCCSSWLTHFVSVGTQAARLQDLSMNPQKLAGQCAKLKCCLNYEADTYMESTRKLPPRDTVLQTKDADYYFFKADILSRMVTYSTDKKLAANLVTIPARRAFEVIALNNTGVKVDMLDIEEKKVEPTHGFIELVGQDSLTRFDKSKKKKKRKNNSQRLNEKGAGDKDAANNASGSGANEEKQQEKVGDNRRKNQQRRRDSGNNGGERHGRNRQNGKNKGEKKSQSKNTEENS